MVFASDEDGANDEPGQKDLTRHGVDTAGLPTSIQVQWNWDLTDLSGANSGDACALFDTNEDGKVNYSLCVVVEGDPATFDSTRLYSCGDEKVDRCTNPIVQLLSFTSQCTAMGTATDPFVDGDVHPNDTTADCLVQMSDFPGPSPASLVNTCSYPSQEPNSDPSDCVLVPRDGFLIIEKIANPDDSSAEFDFALDGAATPVFTAHGSETSGVIPVKTEINKQSIVHSIAESLPPLWSLDSASCDNDSGSLSGESLSEIEIAGDETVTCTFNNSFSKQQPSISTNATASVTVGSEIYDTASLAGGYSPTGTITFSLYGPDDTSCDDDPLFTSQVDVSGNGDYDSNADGGAEIFTATAAGDYRWVASYSGDDNNEPATGTCGDTGESSAVLKQQPSISTEVSDDEVVVGTDIHDVATLAGGYNPIGTITFNLYSDNDCTSLVKSWQVDVNAGNGNYSSPDHTTTAAGTYYWIASYSGDDNNEPVSGKCLDADETVVVDKDSPSITTTASAPIDIGGQINDTAMLENGYNPEGTITFRAYAPGDTQCEVAIFTDEVEVEGNGQYVSDPFTPEAPGEYRWVASYSGDDNNYATSGECGEEGESVIVSKPAIDLSKAVSASPVDAGTTVVFTITATNTGDIGLINVVVVDDTCAPLTYQSGNGGDLDVMEPGESWLYTCSKAITTNTVNVATVNAISLNETPVNDTATAKVDVNVPVVQEVTPTVTLARQTKCVSRSFKLRPRVAGGTVVKSVLTIDGKRRGSSTSTKPVFTVNTAKYTAGKRHKVVVTTTFSTGTQVVTRGSFTRCKLRTASKKVAPIFTGRAD